MTWYTGDQFYDTALIGGFVFAGLIMLASLFGQSAYGRFGGRAPGVSFPPRLGWMLMELPAPLVFAIVYLQGDNRGELVPMLLCGLWMFHYANRGFINPLLMRVFPGSKASFNISVVVFGWIATGLHGYFSAAFISQLSPQFTDAWLSDPRFIIGLGVYAIGFTLNVHSDAVVRNLRPKVPQPNAPRYTIPHGGGFRFVSSPSYLGEMLSWLGFAILTWSLAGVFILLVTMANLVPRALATHGWYKKKFEDYPSDRKALIPYVL
ncbi:methyltransferase [Ferrimonas pelagia]|uniref:3-oxo-5-alpha-steroid 4-dehydrogenase n=1 Tax=Ferrimonas pelagia TaxID=1177826 RepID=A0ABP9FHY3_9GAMM